MVSRGCTSIYNESVLHSPYSILLFREVVHEKLKFPKKQFELPMVLVGVTCVFFVGYTGHVWCQNSNNCVLHAGESGYVNMYDGVSFFKSLS